MEGSIATWDIDVSCPRTIHGATLTGAQVLEQFESFEQVKFGKTTA